MTRLTRWPIWASFRQSSVCLADSFDAQIMLFSATLDHGVDEVVDTFLSDPKVHSVDSATATVDEMTHHVFKTTQGNRHELVRTLLPARAVAFCSPVPNSRRRSLPRI